MPKYHRKYRAEKPLPTPKKVREEPVWEMAPEDMPHVGDIWRITTPAWGLLGEDTHRHYLLLEESLVSDGFSFLVMCLETGLVNQTYFNFQLDDWCRIG